MLKIFGDLIDINTNTNIEVKGQNGHLCSSKEFIPLSQSKINALVNKFKIDANHTSINSKLCLELLSYLKGSIEKEKDIIYIGSILQNLKEESRNLSKAFYDLVTNMVKMKYDIQESINLYYCIIAMHLYCYCKLRNINWFMATTDAGFRIFKSPINLLEAYNMLINFKLTTWPINSKSASIILK